MEAKIRAFHSSDLPTLYRICLKTFNYGANGSRLFSDPELPGHFYAGPYAVLEPDLCFILSMSGLPCGYVLGTRNSEQFYRRCEKEWFPVLRERYPLPDPKDHSRNAEIIRNIHEGHPPQPEVVDYPAHLHIDLLPNAVGKGYGRKMMHMFLDRLTELNVPAVHLGVSRENQRAIAFYKHMGFQIISTEDWGYFMGRK